MIHLTYTLFSRIPVYADINGKLFTDKLWRKDLELHFNYIDDFRLCCPVVPLAMAPKGMEAIIGLDLLKVTAIHKDVGWLSVAKNLIPNFFKVAAALRQTHIAHSGGAGWAFPLSFYILLLRPFLRFQWIIVIESSFWMKPKGKRPSVKQWVSHQLYTVLLGAALRRADARIFTQRGYQRYFQIDDERSLIAPAVWVDEDRIISGEDRQKQMLTLSAGGIRLLFPARMIAEKGADVVMRAITILDSMGSEELPPTAIDMVGEGPMAKECREFAEAHSGPVKVRFLDAVPYGEAFFDLLRGYHAILLANQQEEQPRVIFDAFSQGVPVISSDTSGVRDVTIENGNALLFRINDADGLARQILRFVTDQNLRLKLMDGALIASSGKTHLEMHRLRSLFLNEVLNKDC